MHAVIAGNVVTNVIVWDGNPDEWQPPEGATAIDLGDDSTVGIGWMYVDGRFSAPPVDLPTLTPEQIRAQNTAARDSFLDLATRAMAPLQDAVDLEEATPEETALMKLWKQYRIAVNRVDLTQQNPVWPVAPSS